MPFRAEDRQERQDPEDGKNRDRNGGTGGWKNRGMENQKIRVSQQWKNRETEEQKKVKDQA